MSAEDDSTECDCCGEMKVGCTNSVTTFGMDVHACPKCRGVEEDDEGES